MREIDILNVLFDLSTELKATYNLYQDLLFALQTKNLDRFNHLLQAEHPLISPELQTFNTYQPYIKNTLTTPYPMVRLKELIIKSKLLSVSPLDIIVFITGLPAIYEVNVSSFGRD